MTKEYKYAARNASKEPVAEEVAQMSLMLGRSVHDPLPIEVLDQYWRAKEMGQRGNVTYFSPETLLVILMLAGVEHLTPKSNQVIEYFKTGLLKRHDPIEAKWRGKWKKATIIQASVQEQSIRLVFEDEAGARVVPAGDCRILSKQPESANEPEHAASNV